LGVDAQGACSSVLRLAHDRLARTNRYNSPISYGSVYAAIEPHLREGDRFSVEGTWFAQLIFYYLDFERYASRPSEEWIEILRSPEEQRRPQRLWTFLWGPAGTTDGDAATQTELFCAAGFQATQRVDSRTVSAILFEREALIE
jgi:hypothetical protein